MDREGIWHELKTHSKCLVRIVCADGEVVDAELISALEDADGSRSIMYELVASNRPQKYESQSKSAVWSSDFEGIESVQVLAR